MLVETILADDVDEALRERCALRFEGEPATIRGPVPQECPLEPRRAHLAQAGTVGADDVDSRRLLGPGLKRDLGAVGRPSRATAVCDFIDIASVRACDGDLKDRTSTRSRKTTKHKPAAVWRPSGIEVRRVATRYQRSGHAALRADQVEMARLGLDRLGAGPGELAGEDDQPVAVQAIRLVTGGTTTRGWQSTGRHQNCDQNHLSCATDRGCFPPGRTGHDPGAGSSPREHRAPSLPSCAESFKSSGDLVANGTRNNHGCSVDDVAAISPPRPRRDLCHKRG
jgi:hypothetical protein